MNVDLQMAYNHWGARAGQRSMVQLGVNFRLTQALKLNMSAGRGALSGNDDYPYDKLKKDEVWRKLRNYSFSSPLSEISLSAEIYPVLFFNREFATKRPLFNPYFSLGIGYTFLHPVLDRSRYIGHPEMDGYINSSMPSRPISGTLVIPYQAGLKLSIHEGIDLYGAISVRYAFTDYIDNVANWNSNRRNDGYISYMAGVSVYLIRYEYVGKPYSRWYSRCVN